MFYYDSLGRPIIDGSSGLFAVAAGHGREEITQAVGRQLDELDFAPSFYRGNPPAFLVAEKLAGILLRRTLAEENYNLMGGRMFPLTPAGLERGMRLLSK